MTIATMAVWNDSPKSRDASSSFSRAVRPVSGAARSHDSAYCATAITASVSWDAIRQHERNPRRR
jgi:hypothetical protein